MNDARDVVTGIERSDPRASEQLLPLVYDELRKLALVRLAREKPGQTLQATALVHEAYLRLVGTGDPVWQSRGHFFAAAAEAMRRILVENARRKATTKRGGPRDRLDVLDLALACPDPDTSTVDMLALDAALTRLAAEHPEKAQLVQLRYFGGLSMEEAAQVLGISVATAGRRWAFARAWLLRAIEGGGAEV